jgi:hypothetical protein
VSIEIKLRDKITSNFTQRRKEKKNRSSQRRSSSLCAFCFNFAPLRETVLGLAPKMKNKL